MKRISLIFLILILSLACLAGTVSAEEYTFPHADYLKVTNVNTVFRHTQDPDYELFTLPVGVYVKQLTEADANNYYRVEYNGKQGYVSASSFDTTPVVGIADVNNRPTDLPGGILLHPYHVPVSLLVTEDAQLSVYPGPLAQLGQQVHVNDTLILFGTYIKGQDLYVYVQHQSSGETGAILASKTDYDPAQDVLLPYDEDELFSIEPLPPQTPDGNDPAGPQDNTIQGSTVNPENNLVRVLLIIGICIPAIVIVFLIFKPVRPESGRYATENPKRRSMDFDDYDE